MNTIIILCSVALILLGLLMVALGYPVSENYADKSSSGDVSTGASQYYDWDSINKTQDDDDKKCPKPKPKPKPKPDCKPKKRCTIADLDDEEKNKLCHSCDITINKDIDKYVLKSSVPPCPNMHNYARKSQVPPWPQAMPSAMSDFMMEESDSEECTESMTNKDNKDNLDLSWWNEKTTPNDYIRSNKENNLVPNVERFYGDFEKMSSGPNDSPVKGITPTGLTPIKTDNELSWWNESTNPTFYLETLNM